MSDSDILAIELFFISIAVSVLGIAVTQAGWTNKWFVRGMFLLAGVLILPALFWRELGKLLPALAGVLELTVSSRAAWFSVGALMGAAAYAFCRRICARR